MAMKLLLATLCCLAGSAAAALPDHHPQHRAPKDLLQRIAKSNPSSLRGDEPDHVAPGSPGRRPFTAGLRVTPATLGGDPTGQKDSWEALDAAIQLCLNQSALSPNGFFPGDGTTPRFGPIRDAGGCDIDLGASCPLRHHLSGPVSATPHAADCMVRVYVCTRACGRGRRVSHLQAAPDPRDDSEHAVRSWLPRRRPFLGSGRGPELPVHSRPFRRLQVRPPVNHLPRCHPSVPTVSTRRKRADSSPPAVACWRVSAWQVSAGQLQHRHQLSRALHRWSQARLWDSDQRCHGRHDRCVSSFLPFFLFPCDGCSWERRNG